MKVRIHSDEFRKRMSLEKDTLKDAHSICECAAKLEDFWTNDKILEFEQEVCSSKTDGDRSTFGS